MLNRLVRDKAADLLVMGAYGHSRFREAVLGGATRGMLELLCGRLTACNAQPLQKSSKLEFTRIKVTCRFARHMVRSIATGVLWPLLANAERESTSGGRKVPRR